MTEIFIPLEARPVVAQDLIAKAWAVAALLESRVLESRVVGKGEGDDQECFSLWPRPMTKQLNDSLPTRNQ